MARAEQGATAAYVGTLAVIAAVLVFTFSTMSRLTADLPAESTSAAGRADAAVSQTPRPRLTIEVVGARWNWRFRYRALGIEQAGGGRSIPTLVVPVGDVGFRASSVDVIHSFFIPYLRFKRDALPERSTNFTLGFREPGFHRAEGGCAEFCGRRHAYMQFNVRVLDGAAFGRHMFTTSAIENRYFAGIFVASPAAGLVSSLTRGRAGARAGNTTLVLSRRLTAIVALAHVRAGSLRRRRRRDHGRRQGRDTRHPRGDGPARSASAPAA